MMARITRSLRAATWRRPMLEWAFPTMTSDKLRLALPSKGRMEDATLDFMRGSGLRVARPNPRQYTASIRALPGAQVIFQRPGDIYSQANAGNLVAGITGLDDHSQQPQDGYTTVLTPDHLHDAVD